MSNTSNLVLPYLAVGQAQKHVTLNKSLSRLDAIVQLSVVSATTTAQPGSPTDGAVYIVPSGKTGAQWAAFTDWSLAHYRDGAWEQITPREGWIAYIKDSDLLQVYTGSAWSQATLRTALGLGTAATQNTGTSGANVPLLDAANTWSAAQTISLATTSGGQQALSLESTDNGVLGASMRFFHKSASPALNDDLGRVMWFGNDNAAGAELYGYQGFIITDPTAGSEDGFWYVTTIAGGTRGDRLRVGQGVYHATVSGGDKGANTINLGTIYQNNVQVATLSGAETLSNKAFSSPPRPSADNTITLGDASFRWSEVFAGTGTINTSDANEKTALRPLSGAELRAIRRVIAGVGVYQWLDARAHKGENARLHCGVTAQDVATAFSAEGLDAAHYGVFCADQVESGEGSSVRFGVRYDQLFAMALTALFAAVN